MRSAWFSLVIASVILSCCVEEGALMIADLHSDSLLEMVDKGRDLTKRSSEGHIDIPRLIGGGVRVQVFAAWMDPAYYPDRSCERAEELISAFRDLDVRSDELEQAYTYSDVQRILEEGKIAGIAAIEGGDALEGNPETLRHFYDLGVRVLTLTWSYSNQLADGVYEKFPDGSKGNGGLTDLGLSAVREMNDLGMLIDVSHISEKSFWDVINASEDPVIASHSCAYAICNHQRNLKDEQIRAIAAKGGVIGVNFYPRYLNNSGEASIDDVIAHIDHIAEVGGVDCVALGSDFDGIEKTPKGLEDASRMGDIAGRLRDRGYSSGDVEKIMGGNFLRVFREVCG